MVTNVEEVGWFSRIGDSFKGILFGILLAVISVLLLFWNEGRAVKTAKGLKEGASLLVEIQPESVQASNEGKLVHAVGQVETNDVLRDPEFNLEYNGIRLTRHVEMYQWKESQDTRTEKKLGGGERRITTYSYHKDWHPGVVDSSGFEEASTHQNPTDSLFQNRSLQAKDVSLGAFQLTDSLIGMIGGSEAVSLESRNLPSSVVANTQIRSDGPEGASRIYLSRSGSKAAAIDPVPDEPAANPARPELIDLEASKTQSLASDVAPKMELASSPRIGDVRVWFTATPVTKVSLLSQQNGNSFQPFQTSFGTKINLLRLGQHTAAEMIAQEEAANRMMTWMLRGFGAVLMFFGFSLILKPLVVLADVVPLFGSLVGFGTTLVAGLLTIAGSLTVIAIAWVFYRPVLGVVLLAIAAGVLYMLYKRGKGKTATPERLTEMDLA